MGQFGSWLDPLSGLVFEGEGTQGIVEILRGVSVCLGGTIEEKKFEVPRMSKPVRLSWNFPQMVISPLQDGGDADKKVVLNVCVLTPGMTRGPLLR